MIPVDDTYCDEVADAAVLRARLARLALACLVALALVGLGRQELDDVRIAGASDRSFAAVAFVDHCHSSPEALAWCEWLIFMQDPANAAWFEAATARPALPVVLRRIRGCESGDGPHHPGSYHITNGHGRSTSSGAFQFLDGTWRRWRGTSTAARAYLASPVEQDRAALRLYRAQGTAPWNASRGCWS